VISQFECSLKGFYRRVLYKVSGQKILSFFVASAIVVLLVVLYNKVKTPDAIILKALEVTRDLALGLMLVKGVQNIVGIVKNGDSNGRE
jgi:hypothetical protein